MQKITVLIPCYNSGKFLLRLLTSLEKQTNKDFHIIFLDDFSKDATLSMLKDWTAKNESNFLSIKIIENKENKGIAYNRNLLIDSCETSHFIFFDSDDKLFPKCIEIFSQYLDKDQDMVFSKFNLFFRNIPLVNIFFKYRKIKRNLTSEQIIKSGSSFVWNILINKKFYKETGAKFLEGYNFEDISILPFLVLKATSIEFTNKTTYTYFLNPNSIVNSKSVFNLKSIDANVRYFYELVKKHNLLLNVLTENVDLFLLRPLFFIARPIGNNNQFTEIYLQSWKEIEKINKLLEEWKVYERFMNLKTNDFHFVSSYKLSAKVFKFYTKNLSKFV